MRGQSAAEPITVTTDRLPDGINTVEYQPAGGDTRYRFLRGTISTDLPALPPAADWGQYAAALAEHVRSLLDPTQGRIPEIRDRAAAVLAAWDNGEPFSG